MPKFTARHSAVIAVAALLAGCASGPRPDGSEFKAKLAADTASRQRLAVGDSFWRLQVEQDLRRKPVETTGEFQARTAKLLHTLQTAEVVNSDYFRYDADTETLHVQFSEFPAKDTIVGRSVTYAEYKLLPGGCAFSARRPMELGRIDAYQSALLFVNMPVSCGKDKASMVQSAVRVPRAEMQQAYGNLVWHIDLTPAPSPAGQLWGAYSLETSALSRILVGFTPVTLYELRLVDRATGKVYFRASTRD